MLNMNYLLTFNGRETQCRWMFCISMRFITSR